jgi:hypothetical protein
MFDIYLAELCGQEVCLKTPRNIPGKNYYCSDYFCNTGSETFYGGNTWNPKLDKLNTLPTTPVDDLKIAIGMLLMESQVIQWTQGAWNHSIIGQGVWDSHSVVCDRRNTWDEADRDLRFGAGFLPVLVMPYHRTIRLADLSKTEQKKLFPRMLPALWAALSQMYHGDLSETNILIQPDYSHLHPIDPGVMLVSVSIGYTDNSVLKDDRSASVFTTTAANYPLLPPFDPFLSHRQSLTLQDCLQLSIERNNSYFSTPQLPPNDYEIFL